MQHFGEFQQDGVLLPRTYCAVGACESPAGEIHHASRSPHESSACVVARRGAMAIVWVGLLRESACDFALAAALDGYRSHPVSSAGSWTPWAAFPGPGPAFVHQHHASASPGAAAQTPASFFRADWQPADLVVFDCRQHLRCSAKQAQQDMSRSTQSLSIGYD